MITIGLRKNVRQIHAICMQVLDKKKMFGKHTYISLVWLPRTKLFWNYFPIISNLYKKALFANS